MIRNWLDGPITTADMAALAERAAPHLAKLPDIQDYLADPSRKQLKHFIGVVLDAKGVGEERMGLMAQLDPPVARSDFLRDSDVALRCQLALIDRRIDLGLDDAWVPSVLPYPNRRDFEHALGCTITTDASGYPCAQPTLSSCEQIDDLSCDVASDAACQRYLADIRRIAELTDNRFPIRLGGVSGPLTMAGEALPLEELLTGLYTHPDRVRRLLRLVTDQLIEWVNAQRSQAPLCWCGDWQYPIAPGSGQPFGDDTQIMMSPNLFDQFCADDLRRLGDAFGGLFIHFCGGQLPVIEQLARIKGLRGIDTQMSIEQYRQLREVLGPDVLLLAKVRQGPVGSIGASVDYVGRFLHAARDSRTFVWLNAKGLGEARALDGVARDLAW